MSRKIRNDSKLRGLPAAQRVRVDAWLFEEGRTYEEVVEGCLREFGLKVSKSSVGRYYERISADRFAEMQREKRMAMEPELSPAEAYEVLLQRIAELALEEMDKPLEDINHKVVVRLVRVLLAARREKHMATRVWVERRKAENWMARECLRHWRREMRKAPHVSYLPIWKDGRKQSSRRDARDPQKKEHRLMAQLAPIQVSAVEDLALKRHECRAPGETPALCFHMSPGENTHGSTIGLQSGENSIRKFRTQNTININHC